MQYSLEELLHGAGANSTSMYRKPLKRTEPYITPSVLFPGMIMKQEHKMMFFGSSIAPYSIGPKRSYKKSRIGMYSKCCRRRVTASTNLVRYPTGYILRAKLTGSNFLSQL